MSLLYYLAADRPLEAAPEPENLRIFIENGVSWTEPESWLAVRPFAPEQMDSVFTERPFAAALDWSGGPERKAALLRDYLARQESAEIELWKIWMGDPDRPEIRTRTLPLSGLTAAEIERLEAYEPWNDVIPPPAMVGGPWSGSFDGALPVQRRLVIHKAKEVHKL